MASSKGDLPLFIILSAICLTQVGRVVKIFANMADVIIDLV